MAMKKGWKILIGVVLAVVVLLGLNAVVSNNETKPAEVTVPGGKILDLSGSALQVVDDGPRDASPIVLIHCFTCSINWWDRMRPLLTPSHRVIALDLLGHGGSEKPDSGYSVPEQAELVAQVLSRLGVQDAEVVGHSLGGPVAIALAEQSPQLVDRLVLIDSIPDTSYGDVGFLGELPFKPVLGQALWRIKPDASIRDGLEVAFAPGFSIPDVFVEDVKRMTYSSYLDSHTAFDDYADEEPLNERAAALGLPVLSIMGAEEQIANDPEAALAAYRSAGPSVRTRLIAGAGHSPNVEAPQQTAALVIRFDGPPKRASRKPPAGADQARDRHEMQNRVQKKSGVRGHS
jgi:pimeloyl-ACP methyl ester carboxylesterase